MTLLFAESFDGNDPLPGKWTNHGAGSITTNTPRTGTYCLDATANTNTEYLRKAFSTSNATMIAGGAYRWGGVFDTGTSNGMMRFTGDSDATIHLTLMVETGGVLRVRRGNGTGTVLAETPTGTMPVDAYVYVEMKATLSDTVGAVEVRVNGSAVINETNIDTKNGGTATTFDGFRIAKSRCRIDDIYVCDASGSSNNDFLGDCQVLFRVPTSDATVQWTPSSGSTHYLVVDEVPPNETDYIASSTAGDFDMFGFDPIDTGLTVYGVVVSSLAAKEDAGARSVRHRVDSDTFIATGSDHAPSVDPDYLTYFDVFETDPDGGGQWTPSQVNAASFGVETRA